MSAFEKVLQQIHNTANINGHALANIKNRESLRIAKKEIQQMLKGLR